MKMGKIKIMHSFLKIYSILNHEIVCVCDYYHFEGCHFIFFLHLVKILSIPKSFYGFQDCPFIDACVILVTTLGNSQM